MSEDETHAEPHLASSVERLRHELDRWLEVACSQGGRALDAVGLLRRGSCVGEPPVDVIETPDNVLVVADLPGVDPNAVEITLAGNMLTLKGETPATATDEAQTIHVQQRASGPFSRSIPLPVPVNPDQVSAESKNGTLHIRMNKAESAQAHKIVVNRSS